MSTRNKFGSIMGRNNHSPKLKLIYLLIIMFLPVSGFGQHQNKAGDLKILVSKLIEHKGQSVEHQIGTFYVKENRSDPKSRVIGIGFARYFAHKPKGPPVFFLPGGPGGSYIDSVPPKFKKSGGPLLAEELLGRCDLVFFDQRGYSKHGSFLKDRAFKPKSAPPNATLQYRVCEFKRFAQEVVERYRRTEVDLRGYSILECVEDVNELRKKFGYQKIVLRGQSFGSQWSFGYLKKYPEAVERALLTGVEPLNNAYDMPSHVFNAVQRMWSYIDEDPKFKPYLPDGGMMRVALTVIERLENKPVEVFAKGGKKPVRIIGPDDFPWWDPTAILELYYHRYDRWAQPRNYSIASRTLIQPLIDSSLGVTAQRRTQLWNDPAVRFISRSNFSSSLATANIWPSPDVGDDFRTPVICKVPVVFVNGDWDTKTPIENMRQIAPFFPNSKQVVVHRAGHGTMTYSVKEQHPDLIEKLARFLETGESGGIPDRVTVNPYRTFRVPDFDPPTGQKK